MKSFDVFLLRKMVTLTRRNNLKWEPLNATDILVSDIVLIDVHTLPVSDCFRLERKQKLNPTKEHPYMYELSWERNFISSSETYNTPLYEFGQWLFADDLNWYENSIRKLKPEPDCRLSIEKFQDECDHNYVRISESVCTKCDKKE